MAFTILALISSLLTLAMLLHVKRQLSMLLSKENLGYNEKVTAEHLLKVQRSKSKRLPVINDDRAAYNQEQELERIKRPIR